MNSKVGTVKTLVGAIAVALGVSVVGAGVAHSGEGRASVNHGGENQLSENKLTREEGVGMLGGAATGALVGGPVGAFVGLMVGAIMGDSIGIAKRADLHAQQLEQELLDTRIALAQASERSGGDAMLDALAQRLNADVMFRTGSADVDVSVAANLAELGRLLAVHSQMEVQLNGFADPRGKPAENLELSLRRADAVREALIRGGAAAEQIRLAAHGEDLTTASAGDLEAYAWERRVSLAIRPSATTKVARSQ